MEPCLDRWRVSAASILRRDSPNPGKPRGISGFREEQNLHERDQREAPSDDGSGVRLEPAGEDARIDRPEVGRRRQVAVENEALEARVEPVDASFHLVAEGE